MTLGNIFKFTVHLNHFYDAYCAIISIPDEERKYFCLRRLLIVLYESSAMKILCGGQLPFIGLIENVARARLEGGVLRLNLYKFLYVSELHRFNWPRAASYIYQYCNRMRTEAALRDYQQSSLDLQRD